MHPCLAPGASYVGFATRGDSWAGFMMMASVANRAVAWMIGVALLSSSTLHAQVSLGPVVATDCSTVARSEAHAEAARHPRPEGAARVDSHGPSGGPTKSEPTCSDSLWKQVERGEQGDEEYSQRLRAVERNLISVMRRRERDIRRCYERALARDPGLAGEFMLEFTIGSDGRVTDARLPTNQLGEEVGACVVAAVRRWRFAAVRRWRFDAPDGGEVTVRRPYILASGG